MKQLEKPVGLFLCGGGALGSWQSGVLARLVESGMTFDAVAGFSVGALNGAGYCYGKTGEMRSLWAGLGTDRLFPERTCAADRTHNEYLCPFTARSQRLTEPL